MSHESEQDIAILQAHAGFTQEVSHPFFGQGERATLGQDHGRLVEVLLFPDTRTVQIETPLLSVTLRGSAVSLDEQNDVLEIGARTKEEWTLATINRGGTVLITSMPETPMRAKAESQHTLVQAPVQEAPHATGGEGQKEKRDRVELCGRVGVAPRFRTTQSGELVATFPLAVHEGKKTTWHTVVAFNERAEKLRDKVTKGQEVEVIGYLHTTTKQLKDGQTKETHEIWAAVVKSASGRTG